MNINLFPFNFYIFYAAIVLLIIFLVMTVVKAMPLLKALGDLKQPLEQMSTRVADVSEKAGKVTAMVNSIVSTVKKVVPIMVLLSLANEFYQDSEENGIKEFGRSTVKAIQKQQDEKKLAKNIAKLLK
ncbi:MAG: hypothetical protein IKF00_13515 [Solobacterium sp.]|jgi:hypothetical protein|nr:hypothetical protein [Solobacterium sp.]MBR3342602.1 hypothetical protein [Solobacterium sp.]HAE15094.1 hypothetical protein [Erysipelotrichaceae bacterium]